MRFSRSTSVGLFLTSLSVTAAAGVGCARISEVAKDGAEAVGLEPDDGTDAIRRVCPSNRNPDGSWVVVEGLDTSDWGFVDWARIVERSPQYKYAFLRTSAGLVRVDTRFVPDWRTVRTVGLIRGAYQYFKPSQSAIKQADLFLRMTGDEGGFLPDDLPPVFDLETTNGMPVEAVKCKARIWLSKVERATGRVPIIYTSAQQNELLGPELRRYPLWVANYVGTPSVTCPRVPEAWPKWALWQHTDKMLVDGIYGNAARNDGGLIERDDAGVPVLAPADANYFDGTMDDLKALIANSVSTGAVPDAPLPANPPHVTQTPGGEVLDCSDGCCVVD